MARLREVYPNMMEIQFARSRTGNAAAPSDRGNRGDCGNGNDPGDHRRREPADLFRAFYRDMVGTELGDAALGVFNDSVRSVRSASSASDNGTERGAA